MTNIYLEKPFKTDFLNQLFFSQNLLGFDDGDFALIDQQLHRHQQLFSDPEIERNLLSQNEFLASFAISKAEDSSLTVQEAEQVYELLLADESYAFITAKLARQGRLTRKDYEKLEFFNIARVFRSLQRAEIVSIEQIDAAFILDLHRQLTAGLDLFATVLPHFDVYRAGQWRNHDLVRVADYVPAPHQLIVTGVAELLAWLQAQPSVTRVGVFHTALYALHPFTNGNKRTCRVLEHLLLRLLGFNRKNLYSTSYYYHQQKARYYKYLLFSLQQKNLTHFVAFFQESLALSMLSVVKASIELKRKQFLYRLSSDKQVRLVCKPLIKQRELQFKNLLRRAKHKVSRQTFVNHLHSAVEQGILHKRVSGRVTFYSLQTAPAQELIFQNMLAYVQNKLDFIPDDIRLG